jgi:CMP-N,N'-diacetyllegionaminic acid synthase
MPSHPPAIAIILARAGSKGVPGKNIAPIAGKPCIAWTIEHALASRGLSMVAVSTDDPGIADLVRSRYPQLSLVTRPAALATDAARVDDAARHAVLEIENHRADIRRQDTRIAILYANVPVRPPGLVDQALTRMTPDVDSVQSYQSVGKFHPWWTCRLGADGAVSPWEGDILNHGVFRRQDLPPAFIPDGAVLIVTRRSLMLEVPGVPSGPHAFFGETRRGIVTTGDVVDIDSPADVLAAEAILRGTVMP